MAAEDFININLDDVDDGREPLPDGPRKVVIKTIEKKDGKEYPYLAVQLQPTDEEYATSGRDALYYVRAIEVPSLAVQADPLGCTRDEVTDRCIAVSPCRDRPWEDDCLAETEERAWSSPIYVRPPVGLGREAADPSSG